MSDLSLSRTLDPVDYAAFAKELAIVDRYDNSDHHPHRRWEYALTLHAIGRWSQMRERRVRGPLYDVGGAGSHLAHMLTDWTECAVEVIDPRVSRSLDQEVVAGSPLADVVTCISVIEHIFDVDRFLYHLSCLVAPGGLLVLTMDYWNECGPDLAHFHNMRQRIYCPQTYAQLRAACEPYHLTTFGGLDPTWHGAHVYEYTFASLVLEKRP